VSPICDLRGLAPSCSPLSLLQQLLPVTPPHEILACDSLLHLFHLQLSIPALKRVHESYPTSSPLPLRLSLSHPFEFAIPSSPPTTPFSYPPPAAFPFPIATPHRPPLSTHSIDRPSRPTPSIAPPCFGAAVHAPPHRPPLFYSATPLSPRPIVRPSRPAQLTAPLFFGAASFAPPHRPLISPRPIGRPSRPATSAAPFAPPHRSSSVPVQHQRLLQLQLQRLPRLLPTPSRQHLYRLHGSTASDQFARPLSVKCEL